MCENKREKMMQPQVLCRPRTTKRFVDAFAPFPRGTWIHPHVPIDSFDHVCRNIWRRVKEAEEEQHTGQSSTEREQNKDCTSPNREPTFRAEEQQEETDDLGLSILYKEDKRQYHPDFILPCPYLSGHRHAHDAEPAQVLSSVMEAEMKRSEGEAKGKRYLRDVEDKQRSVENSQKKILVTQSSSRRDKQSSALEPQRLAPNPMCSASEDHTSHLQEELPRDACESEDEQNERSSSDSSDDDDLVTLPGVRTCATDSSDDDSESDSNDCEEEKDENPRSSDELSSDGEQDFPSFITERDFPPLSSIKAGVQPCPTEPPASGKMHGQWEIPLSCHPHDIPTATLASDAATHVQAPVQGKAEAPQANSETNAPAAAPTQQKAYDLLADFPALQPPMNPLTLGVLRDEKPNAKDAEGKRGLVCLPNHRQESEASHRRRMENVPREVSSICAGDQKSVLDLQTFGSTNQSKSPTISCEEPKAKSQPPPRVAGTDGVGGNARSWASAAKAGMKQAAAPQEKARPCTFQPIVTINRAKGGYTAVQNFTQKVTPFHPPIRPLVTTMCHGPQPRNPSRFVRPSVSHIHQQVGARQHRANGPPGFICPRFPFQQARGPPLKHMHVRRRVCFH